MEGKSWYKSKTIGFGALLGALGLAILALPEFGAIVNTLPPEILGGVTLIISVITVVLRFLTNQPIE